MLALEAQTRVGALELDVSLDAAPGRCLALVGPSGAGKTSVLRIVAGLHAPARGRVACGAATWLDTARGIDVPSERRGCGYVFQDYALFAHMSVWRNVAYGLRGVERDQRRARATALLEQLGIAALADARPGRLSGGERQRVALARALAMRPRALLLDEPLAALDARSADEAGRALVALLRDLDVPALLVTHDFMEAALLADEVAVLDGGRVVQRGTATQLAAEPVSPFVADLTGAVVLTGTVRADAAEAGGLALVELDGGGTVATTATTASAGPVAVAMHPWEVTIEPAGSDAHGSARNRLDVEVVTVTEIGNRVRLGLVAAQPLAAEITRESAQRLGLAPGVRAVASWKAAATRLLPR